MRMQSAMKARIVLMSWLSAQIGRTKAVIGTALKWVSACITLHQFVSIALKIALNYFSCSAPFKHRSSCWPKSSPLIPSLPLPKSKTIDVSHYTIQLDA